MQMPIVTRILFPDPAFIEAQLERVRRARLVDDVPNLWQLTLGVLRMMHRARFRSNTIGTSRDEPVRATFLARVLQVRALRMPALFAVRALHPWDLSGLLSTPRDMAAHLLGAHHDRNQFAYDLQILSATSPESLAPLAAAARHLAEASDMRARFFRDLTVFERYHARLADAVERAIRGDFQLTPEEADDPDVSFVAYLAWCARQPSTPAATLAAIRTGAFRIDRTQLGLVSEPGRVAA